MNATFIHPENTSGVRSRGRARSAPTSAAIVRFSDADRFSDRPRPAAPAPERSRPSGNSLICKPPRLGERTRRALPHLAGRLQCPSDSFRLAGGSHEPSPSRSLTGGLHGGSTPRSLVPADSGLDARRGRAAAVGQREVHTPRKGVLSGGGPGRLHT